MTTLKYRREKKTKKQEPSPIVSREKLRFADDQSTIIQYAIMHDKVCEALVEYKNKKAFSLPNITRGYRNVYRKVINYYKEYKQAPKRTVNLLFTKELTSDNGIIPELLEGIAMEYEANKAGYTISPEFVIDSVLPRFIKNLKLNRLLDDLDRALSNDLLKEGEKYVLDYEVPTIADSESLVIFEPTKLEYYEDLFTRMKTKGNTAFEFKKDLGDIRSLVGPLMRGWLVSVAGTTKAGKSALLLDIAISAAYDQNKKVIVFSPEMTEHDLILERYIPWLVEIPYNNFMKRQVEFLPKIDCIKNQMGNCTLLDENKKQSRPNSVQLYGRTEKGYSTISINDRRVKKWKVCTICRNKRGIAKHFSPAPFWFKEKFPKPFVELDEKKQMALIRESLDRWPHIRRSRDNLKIKIIPKYTKTLEYCIGVINKIETEYKWKPDIIIFDYLDILQLDENNKEGKRHELISDMWKNASALAQEKEALVITADQTTGKARDRRQIDHTVTPEAVAKDNHVDKKIGIVKFRDETNNNICRVNMIYDRHAPFDRKVEVLVTQDLTYGMGITDSVFWYDGKMPPYPFILEDIK